MQTSRKGEENGFWFYNKKALGVTWGGNPHENIMRAKSIDLKGVREKEREKGRMNVKKIGPILTTEIHSFLWDTPSTQGFFFVVKE